MEDGAATAKKIIRAGLSTLSYHRTRLGENTDSSANVDPEASGFDLSASTSE